MTTISLQFFQVKFFSSKLYQEDFIIISVLNNTYEEPFALLSVLCWPFLPGIG